MMGQYEGGYVDIRIAAGLRGYVWSPSQSTITRESIGDVGTEATTH
jgi:hypothetical protein